jgi:hypothetical protein
MPAKKVFSEMSKNNFYRCKKSLLVKTVFITKNVFYPGGFLTPWRRNKKGPEKPAPQKL